MAGGYHFERTARVKIIPPSGTGIEVNPRRETSGLSSFRSKHLRVSFEIEREISESPSKAAVRIFNLAQRSRERAAGVVRRRSDFSSEFAFLDGRLVEGSDLGGSAETVETANGFAYLRVEAGADGRSGTIFEGGTSYVESDLQGRTWRTELRAGDGELAIDKAVANRSFTGGTPTAEIVRYLARTMGLGPGNLQTPPPALTAATVGRSGAMMVGRSRDALSRLAKGLGLRWYVDLGELWVIEARGYLAEPAVPVTKLIGKPQPLTAGVWQVRTPLDSRLRPGLRIALQSSTLSGTFRANKVAFRGDNRSGAWETQLELDDLSPIPGII